ncbi:growth/differentiation factor 8, partial [Biomphalaria glabrata]
ATPKSTSEDMWRDKSQPGLRLNFNLPRLDRKHESDEVRTARLNLFIKPRKDCPCVDEDDKEMSDYLVTIYQFIKPLTTKKRNRVVYKQKILNAVMVPAQGNAWLTIDIKRAVTIWMKKTRKNFGVEVTVQDSYGATINAKEIFVLPDCSNTRSK